MSRETDNLSRAEVRELDIAWFWKMIANMTTVVAVALIIGTAATVTALVGHNSFSAHHAEQERYTQTEATIVSEPDLANGTTYRSYATVSARVATENGLETTTAVDSQAQAGDTVTVWVDNDTNTLWRATSAGASPIVTQPMTDTVFSGILTTLGMVIALIILAWRSNVHLERGLYAKRQAERDANRRYAWQ